MLSFAIAVALAVAPTATPAEQLQARAASLAEGEALTVVGRDRFLFLRKELRHLAAGPFWGEAAAGASQAVRPDQQDPLVAILDTQRQLAARGIDLLVVPVPPKAAIYPDALPGEPALTAPGSDRRDGTHIAFYGELRAAGVNVVDLVPLLLAERAAGRTPYLKTDTHWSPRAIEAVAGLLGKQIADLPGYRRAVVARAPATLKFTSAPAEVTFAGDLIRGVTPEPGLEQVEVQLVRTVDGSVVLPDPSSPVLVLGDSHTLVFHDADLYASGAGLSDHLAVALGHGVDLIGVRGSGARAARVSLYRKAKADPAYLGGKGVVVWVFAARDFTEAEGWGKVPVGPEK